jgi:acyl-CoA synthetase (NDP forming)
MPDLKRLLRPQSIAVVGGKPAAMVIQQCRLMGYEGDIWPVHPSKAEIEGLPTFQTIEDLPAAPDATFIGVNRHLTIGIVESLAKRGAGGAVCYASGFLEADEEGGNLQADLLRVAGDMPMLGPNCYGFINYAEGALLWPDQHGGRRLDAGESGVAIITQSSNLSINITMQQRGLPIAYMLTAGNQAMIGASDLAMAVLDDPRVTCLGMHIEGFDSIVGMEAVARKARKLKKPVVVLKVGKSEQAQQATLTHTASLAGAHASSQAFLKRLGIGQVDTVAAMLETLKLLHVHGVLPGYKLGSMSCSGGEASLIADAVQGKKVYFPELTQAEKQPLQDTLGPLVTVNNPLDYHTYIWANEAGMTEVYAGMLMAENDLTMLLLDFPHPDKCQADDWEIALCAFEAAAKRAFENGGAKAVLTSTISENIPEPVIARMMQQGIAAIAGMEEVVIAAEVAADIGEAWRKSEAEPVLKASSIDRDSAPSNANELNSVTLDEADAKAALAACGVSVPQGQKVSSKSQAVQSAESFGYPVVLKALGIAHKTEANAVRLNLHNEQAVSEAFEELQVLSDMLYLESMIQATVAELIVGLSRDPQFGLVMTIGAGGILVEILKDSATLLLPATSEEIEQSLLNLKTAPLLQGYRGRSVADVKATVQTILKLQDYAIRQAEHLQELDINPLIICAEGQGAYAADALIVTS